MDIFTARTPEDQISFLFEDVDADVIVCGHTHLQFDRTIGGKRVVNAGSVGAPAEDEAAAYWLLDLEPRRTEYADATRVAVTRAEWLDWLESLPTPAP
jgi:predicted phosphodiesterase